MIELLSFLTNEKIQLKNKLFASLAMGFSFNIMLNVMPFNLTRMGIQIVLYFIVAIVFLKKDVRWAISCVSLISFSSYITETLIMLVLNRTLIGIDQLLQIDSFYALIVMFDATLLSLVMVTIKYAVRSFKMKGSQDKPYAEGGFDRSQNE